MNRRMFLLAAGLATALVAPGSGVAQTKMTLGYTSANAFLAAFVAKDQKFFEKRGLDVTLQRIPIGSTIPGAIMAGSLQIGTLTPPVFIQAVEGGLPLVIVQGATTQNKENSTAGVVARPEANVGGPADFKGKKVGVPGLNGVQHVTFLKWLRDRNVDPKQVTFIEAAFPQMGDMLKGGQIDAALPVEPFLSRIVNTNAGKLVARYTGEVVPQGYLESFYTSTKQWAESNPKAVADFRAALDEALAFIKSNPEEAKKSQITHLGLPPEVVANLPLPTFAAKVAPEQIKFWIDLTKDFGIAKGTTTPEQLLVK